LGLSDGGAVWTESRLAEETGLSSGRRDGKTTIRTKAKMSIE